MSDSADGVATMVPGVSERSGGTTRFFHLDRLGTNAKTTDASGSVVGSAGYDAFGHQAQYGNVPGSQAGFAAGYGYQEDGETNLKLLGHRDYDPATGRFLTRDPAHDGSNWYRYVANNPVSSVDPDGLRALKNVDIERMRNLYKYRGQVSLASINAAVREYKEAIRLIPDGEPDPANLQALGWAIDHLGDTSYAAHGDDNYCNYFVSDAYTEGAGVSMPDRSMRPGTQPFSANTMGDPDVTLEHLARRTIRTQAT